MLVKLRRAAGIAAALALSGCASGYTALDTLKADPAWAVYVHADHTLAPSIAAYRAAPQSSELWVYVEGDGRSWVMPSQISSDPTPDNPVGLKLAMAPQDAAVLYLGRPCQYLRLLNASCANQLWSLERYSSAVVAQLSRVLDEYKARSAAQRVVLVGYSGGGVLATLLAAKRSDIAGLVTLAANLSVADWVNYHKITPLVGSLDPARDARDASRVPQVHVAGLKDDIVLPHIVRNFVSSMPVTSQIRVLEEAQFTHTCCWAEEWSRLRRDVRTELVRLSRK